MLYYNEAFEARQAEDAALLTKWEKALNIDGGIQDEHMARTTAICLENYLTYLHDNPQLIAEDRIQSGAFTGVNLALLGLIARVVPNLIGAELVGIQAMPTPSSPIFTLQWYKDTAKGTTGAHEEMWVTPVPQTGLGLDPFYTSQIVFDEILPTAFGTALRRLVWANADDNMKGTKPFLFASSMYVTAYDATGAVLADYKLEGDYASNVVTATKISGATLTFANPAFTASTRTVTIDTAWPTKLTPDAVEKDVAKYVIRYEYKQESEPNVAEMSFKITEERVTLLRRQLRGKYSLDSAFDLKKYHGINIDTELSNMMKVELQAEINREIVSDLRMLAGITKTFNYADFVTDFGIHNYDDAHKALLDAVNQICAEIHVVGRLGRGNFVVANPTTLAFLDRVPGFVGSGVSYNGKEMSFAGTIGGKIKFYFDPLFPRNELLIGYKGPGALDAGYIHAPYLPITATPTMIHPETGDPSKLFYTRYGKTFYVTGGTTKNLILNGQYQYARLLIVGFPSNLLGF